MALPELQKALVRAVAGNHPVIAADLPDPALTDREASWLKDLSGKRGLEVISDVQHWWRRARLRTALPLSSRLMDRFEYSDDDSPLESYLRQQVSQSLHFLEEGQQFLQFLKNCHTPLNNSQRERLQALVRFEMGVREASDQIAVLRSPGSNNQCKKKPMTEPLFDIHQSIFRTYILFPCDPAELIAALAGNRELPPDLESPVTVLVDSDIPHYWQIVDLDLELE